MRGRRKRWQHGMGWIIAVLFLATIETTRAAGVTRQDLAAIYQFVDRNFTNHPPAAERIAPINRAFDSATLAFFSRDMERTMREMTAVAVELLPAPVPPSMRVLLGTRASVLPSVVQKSGIGEIMVELTPLMKLEEIPSLELTIELVAQGKTLASQTKTISLDGPQSIEIPWNRSQASEGIIEVVFRTADGARHPACRFFLVEQSRDSLRQANEARLDAIVASWAGEPRTDLVRAASILRARNRLLTDAPDPGQSTQFLADQVALARELEGELRSLSQGNNPYANRVGDYWRVTRQGALEIPYRLYCPPASTNDPTPLVVAFHGAGGDENMFFDGYGAGRIKELADQHGAIVVTPLTYTMTLNPLLLGHVLADVEADYTIDPTRRYVLGHSMGAGVTTGCATKMGDTFAAAVALAGGGRMETAKSSCPVLFLPAELDPIIPPTRIDDTFAKAKAAGLPVELRLVKDYGHTLMVGPSLPEAFDWIFQHQKPTARE